MERQVIYRDRQELLTVDLNNVQAFTSDSLAHMVMDAITNERMYVGFNATMHSATELDIAAGRLWDGQTGKVYAGGAQTQSLFSNLPVQDEKWVAVSLRGQEEELDLQPRDFLINIESAQTEPSMVAMERARTVATHITAGLESPGPQKPEIPTGNTLVAYVRLSTDGIQEIVANENGRLMQLFEVWQGSLANARWITSMTPRLMTLFSDLAALASRLDNIASTGLITQLAADVALLRDKVQLPDNTTAYDADNFLNSDASAPDGTGYYARVLEGVRFPYAGLTEQQLALFNPYETAVVQRASGMILPAYTPIKRLSTGSVRADGLQLSQYQYTERTFHEGVRTYVRTIYSPTETICTNGSHWKTGQYEVVQEVFEGPYTPPPKTSGKIVEDVSNQYFHWPWDQHRVTREQYWWKDWFSVPYTWVESVEHTISGSQVAQTFLVAQNGWLTHISLNFEKVAADGAVHMLLCETDHGLPDPERVLGRTTVEAANLAVGAVDFEFPDPLYLQAGARYAIILVTAGDHTVSLVEGTEYTQGTLFYSTDGDWFQGDLEKDLMMSTWFAQFANPRTVVELSSLSLSEGIAGLHTLAQITTPPATEYWMEYRADGQGDWKRVDQTNEAGLLGLPAMLNLRAVFVGSSDVMPAVGLAGSKLRAFRCGDTFKHISTMRELAAPSAQIQVILLLEGWDETKHACTASLRSGETVYAATAVTDEPVADGSIRRTATFEPNAPDGISEYQIVIEGTTSTALKCFHVAQRMDVAL
ncbi:hypothetical protein [Oceanidesulfovibrio marinus]|uniref:Phage tail protein n=1 Tax=Oceanidesulfovibrio marinus TaxID=370038 RepID=A0ABX6NI28_9BACT|nr:hypothetical protein [Oceanidesulfovibrio marinus]QJT10222.1 hypothetical protein E8L03_15360 [Oceanidesulfovibrio marinus]